MKRKNNIEEERIVYLYKRGDKIKDICVECNTNATMIYKILNRLGARDRNKEIKLTDEGISIILKRFKDGESATNIGKDFGLSKINVYDLAKENDVNTRRNVTRDSNVTKEVKAMYNAGVSLKDIKKKFNFKNDTSIYNCGIVSNRNNYKRK